MEGSTPGGRRPRLLFVVTLAEVGGVASYASQLLPGLVRRFDVCVAASGDGPLRDVSERLGIRFVGLRHLRRSLVPVHDVMALAELRRLMRRERFDIVHAHSSKAGILARTAGALAGVPIRIFTVHGWAFAAYRPPASSLFRWADRLMRPLTTVIVAPARAVMAAGIAARTCSAERTVVIPNAVDTSAFATATPGEGVPRVITVGRLAFPKDFDTFLQGMSLLGDRSFSAAIAGDGPERPELEARAGELALGDRVAFLGTRDDVPDLLADSGVFVLSSRSECLPMSIIEAMAAGLPVVASAVGGVPEIVVPGETGLLVPPGDAPALAAAIGRLLDDADLRRRMGAAGRERARARFDVQDFRRAHVALYRRELLARGLPAPPVEAEAAQTPVGAGSAGG